MTDFATTLRSWRQTRRFSQLDLALEAEVSARHISFLETGRSKPSRDMIARLGTAMDLPLEAQNTLLTHAGFATRFAARDWSDLDMAPIMRALVYTMDRHAPYPAMALDRDWNIFRLNTPAQRLYGMMGLTQGDSLLDLLTSAQLPAMVENWPDVAHHTAHRLRTESAAAGGIARLDQTAHHLSKAAAQAAAPVSAVLPMVLNVAGLRLSMFATLSQFGTPQDLTVDALRIELFFPADDASKSTLETMASADVANDLPAPDHISTRL